MESDSQLKESRRGGQPDGEGETVQMAENAGIVGIAMQNFTAYPQMPDAQGLIEFGVRMEELGYESVWVWDHILLGVDPCL